MTSYRAASALLFIAVACGSAAVQAGSCSVISNSLTEPATIKAGGQQRIVAPDRIVLIEDCDVIEVVNGKIKIRGLVQGQSKRLLCDIAKPKPCALPATSLALAGPGNPYSLKSGGKLMDKEVENPGDLPNGNIYDPQVAATFDFPGSMSGGHFALVQGNTSIFNAAADGRVVVPAQLLHRDGDYQWRVTSGGRLLANGSFKLLAADTAERVRSVLEKSAAASISPSDQVLNQLDIYYLSGLPYEFNRVKAQLGGLQ